MKITKQNYLPADLAQVKNAKEFKRFNLFGFRFGPSKVKELKLERVDSAYGPVLTAQVLIGKKWQALSQDAVDTITVRHIDLAVHTTQLLGSPSLNTPTPTASAELSRSGAIRRALRSLSAPSLFAGPSLLARSNAMRRVASAPGVVPADVVTANGAFAAGNRPVLVRGNSVASMAASVYNASDDSPASRSSATLSDASTAPSSVGTVSSAQWTMQQKVDAYLAYMAHPNAYGTDVELFALSQANPKMPIKVLQLMAEKDGTLVWGHTVNGDFVEPEDVVYDPLSINLFQSGAQLASSASEGNHFVPIQDLKLLNLNKPASLAAIEGALGSARGDGSCLFDSIAQQVGGGVATPATVRAQAVAWLRANAFTAQRNGVRLAELMADNRANGKLIIEQSLPVAS